VQDGKRRYVLPDWEPDATPRAAAGSPSASMAPSRHALDGTALVDWVFPV
jgi:hypothetical protein